MGRLSSLFDNKKREENRRLIEGYISEKAKREAIPQGGYRTNTGAMNTAPTSYSPAKIEGAVDATPTEPSLYAKYKNPLENKVAYGGIHDAPVSFAKQNPTAGSEIKPHVALTDADYEKNVAGVFDESPDENARKLQWTCRVCHKRKPDEQGRLYGSCKRGL